eukprot:7975571-Alexandrium_andersonii.AAC.1
MLAGGVPKAAKAARLFSPRLLQALSRRDGGARGHPIAGCRGQGRPRCEGGWPYAEAFRRRQKAATAPCEPL